jgi:CRP-like cAMP-binding protein
VLSIEVLRSLPYFAGVSAESLKQVAELSEERAFTAGEVLFREDDTAGEIYILRNGEIDIVYGVTRGDEKVVDTVVVGDLIGWSALVEPFNRTATAVARQAGTAVVIDGKGIQALCDRDQSLGYHLVSRLAETLSRRLQGALVQIAAAS